MFVESIVDIGVGLAGFGDLLDIIMLTLKLPRVILERKFFSQYFPG